MDLFCPACKGAVEQGKPIDANIQMPPDRKRYRHTIGRDALCPKMGVTAQGVTGYVPTLPTNKR